MDDKEKYRQALEKAKRLYEQGTITESLAYIFPELAESEDERIRKRLLTDFSVLGREEWGGLKVKDICAWLEKQESLPEGCVRKQVAEAKETLYSAPCTDTINGQGITNQLTQSEVTKTSEQVWSEEDEKMSENILSHLREYYVQKKGYPYVAASISPEMEEFRWLKSLKERLS